MKRSWLIWCIQWYSDDRKPWPKWLRRQVDSDPYLARYARRLSSMEEALLAQSGMMSSPRNAAPQATVISAVEHSPRNQSGSWSSFSGAKGICGGVAMLAATLCLMLGLYSWKSDSRESDSRVSQNGRSPQHSSVHSRVHSGDAMAAERAAPNSNGVRPLEQIQRISEGSGGGRLAWDWLRSSVNRTGDVPKLAVEQWDGQFRSEVQSLRDEFRNSTRWVAVDVPMASLKFLGVLSDP